MSNPLDGTIPAPKCANCPHHVPLGEVTGCRYCGCTEHRPARSPYGGHDPQTPPGAEAALEAFSAALEPARLMLAGAVDAEADADLDREMARARLMLCDECPVTGTFGGVRTTVGQRDAWVLLHSIDEERAWKKAVAARKMAEKYLDVIGRKLSAQQSIAKSVGGSYMGTPR